MTVLAEVAEEIEELEAYMATRLAQLRARLRAYDASLGDQGDVEWVGSGGRLTEAGIRYCEEAFAEGRGPTEIAGALGVTVPAIVVRRQRWAEEQERQKASQVAPKGRK